MLENKRKNADTHSEFVILIAFPRQQLLHESNSMFRYMYIACPARECNIVLHIIITKTVHLYCFKAALRNTSNLCTQFLPHNKNTSSDLVSFESVLTL